MFSKTMTIYMKSGNTIKINGVISFDIKGFNGRITELTWDFSFLRGFRMREEPFIDLSQIEAIVLK